MVLTTQQRPGESLDRQSAQLLPFKSVDRRQSSAGFVLADRSLKPIYANDSAFHILNYSNESQAATEWAASLQERLRIILQVTRCTTESFPLTPFVSGRRRYVCRSFLLEVREGDTRPPLVALLMERPAQQQAGLFEANRRFHLSPREYETVQHLTQGLTTKEIAQRMNVSPNTVKQFVRLIMSKMRVTTRSGILGKLLSS